MKLAMWSGPRNLSTAMMYSFANREDFSAVDEPFYAAYLANTGLDHPMREHVMQAQDQSYSSVISSLIQPNSVNTHQYQKHQTQHMIDGVDRDWMRGVTNVFLIRHPARVLASYTAKRANPTLEDIGFSQQKALFEKVCAFGHTPTVIDAYDIRRNPEAQLRALCDRIGLDFYPSMLNWPKGPKPFDGVWASHWYGSVHQSTGFAGAEGDLPTLPKEQRPILDEALEIYEQLSGYKLAI
ncbi:HAD family hydrolase [Algirhabdus cladophorae]|uniref:sulfotransferase-like domain-containing protein n=1 Tax=Algirhabdus cladophorae TaxID=3377108 RepID=UPI003B84A2A4